MVEGRYHHGDLRRALLEAAAALLAEEGEAALTLRAVARRSGVSHSAPYRHFSDRKALLAALAAHALEELAGYLGELPPRPEAAATGVVRFALEQPGRYKLLSDAPAESGVAEARAAVLRAVTRACGAELAQSVWALAHGAALLGLAGAVDDPVQLAERGARALCE